MQEVAEARVEMAGTMAVMAEAGAALVKTAAQRGTADRVEEMVPHRGNPPGFRWTQGWGWGWGWGWGLGQYHSLHAAETAEAEMEAVAT